MAKSFDDKVVWITGGGSGIGRAMAHEFAHQGAIVAVSGRREDRLEEVVSELAECGSGALAVPLDVTDAEATHAAVARIVDKLGRLDVAVANAGFGVAGRFEKLTAEDWKRQFDVNVLGAVHTAQAALPELHKTDGRLAFIASIAAFLAAPGSGPYCASKAALRSIGLTLSAELAGTGVSCTTVHPGYVESEIAQVDNEGVFDADRKDKRPSQLMWPADKAARVTVAAIRRRKREHVFTTHGKIGVWFGQHTPGLVHALVTRGKRKRKARAA